MSTKFDSVGFRNFVFSILLAVVSIGCQRARNDGMSGAVNRPEDVMKGIATVQAPETPESLAEKKAKLESNLSQAIESASKGNVDQAIALLEESVTLDSKHREVLLRLVELLRQRSREVVTQDPARSYRLMVQAGFYLQALKAAHATFSKEEKELFASVLFDEACAHARSKRREEFSGAFNAAIEEGFADVERLMNEPDLAEFREVPEMKQLIDKAIQDIRSRK
ncbi:MAG: hypothetical protein ABL921_09380 [Pirellula sp.]